jgi:hypothetical protein
MMQDVIESLPDQDDRHLHFVTQWTIQLGLRNAIKADTICFE